MTDHILVPPVIAYQQSQVVLPRYSVLAIYSADDFRLDQVNALQSLENVSVQIGDRINPWVLTFESWAHAKEVYDVVERHLAQMTPINGLERMLTLATREPAETTDVGASMLLALQSYFVDEHGTRATVCSVARGVVCDFVTCSSNMTTVTWVVDRAAQKRVMRYHSIHEVRGEPVPAFDTRHGDGYELSLVKRTPSEPTV